MTLKADTFKSLNALSIVWTWSCSWRCMVLCKTGTTCNCRLSISLNTVVMPTRTADKWLSLHFELEDTLWKGKVQQPSNNHVSRLNAVSGFTPPLYLILQESLNVNLWCTNKFLLPTDFKLQEPCVLYIRRAYRYPPDVAFYIFFSTTISTEYFKHAAHSPFFSSKCGLFHNATSFGSCIIHILHTGCAKI